MGQGSSPFSFFHATATAALASKGPRLTFRTILVETPSRAAILRMLSRARKASRIRRSISGGYRRLAKLLAEVVARPDIPVDVARSRGDRFAGPSRGDYGKGTVNKGLISARQRLAAFIARLIEDRVIRRHLWVGLRKFRGQGDYTFLIETDDGRVRRRAVDGPVFTNPRLGPALTFLRDVHLIDEKGLTARGEKLVSAS
jgi:hypothetical protein